MAIERLGALDRFMLRVSATWPQDIGAVVILDGAPLHDASGRFRIEAAREAIGSRLQLVPRFRQVIHVPRRGFGPPLWVDARDFDLARHVLELRLEPPVGEAELFEAVERLRRQPLDPSCPLWEMWFLTGLAEHEVALFVRIHHSIGDGMAAMATLTAFLDRAPDAPATAAAAPWQPAPPPSARALLADNLARRLRAGAASFAPLLRPRSSVRQLKAAWPAIRELFAETPATRTSIDRMVGPGRNVAIVRARLADLKAIGRTCHATVNDVLLAATSAGLRRLLESRGEAVARTTVRVYVPVTLRRRWRGPQQGNLIAQMAVPLELGEPDPVRRLRQIAAETTRRKARARTSLGALFVGGGLGRRVLVAAVMRQRVNVTTASIPGPPRPLYLAGARLLEVVPILPLVANEPLGIGALSYAGALAIGITADRDAFPDLDVLTEAMRDDLCFLGAACQRTIPAAREPLSGSSSEWSDDASRDVEPGLPAPARSKTGG